MSGGRWRLPCSGPVGLASAVGVDLARCTGHRQDETYRVWYLCRPELRPFFCPREHHSTRGTRLAASRPSTTSSPLRSSPSTFRSLSQHRSELPVRSGGVRFAATGRGRSVSSASPIRVANDRARPERVPVFSRSALAIESARKRVSGQAEAWWFGARVRVELGRLYGTAVTGDAPTRAARHALAGGRACRASSAEPCS